MSSLANWSYTATATIWRKLEGNDEYGDPLGYAEPEQIPVVAGADEVRQVIRYADTFERLADDYAILTGV